MLFCNTGIDKIHQVTTFEMDKSVRKYAHDIQDTGLLAKLNSGDRISQEAMYHLKCEIENFFTMLEIQLIMLKLTKVILRCTALPLHN